MSNQSTFVNDRRMVLFTILVLLAAAVSACAGDGSPVTTGEEESGTELMLDESYDAVRNGARLVLTYDAQSNSFNGFVENATDESLKQVRVEVHLSSGVELGPTTPTDLGPGERLEVNLAATDEDFDRWTAHPEVGGGEHGEEGEGGHQDGDSD